MANNNGPNIESCGTPTLNSFGEINFISQFCEPWTNENRV